MVTADLDPGVSRPSTRFGERRRKRLAALGVVVAVAFISVVIVEALSRSSTVDPANLVGPAGRPAPTFALQGLRHPADVVSLASFRGQPLVINFWSSWCIPCRTEMPVLEGAFQTEGGKVAFLGIDSNDTSKGAMAFLAQVHVTYPVASDPHGDLAASYGLVGLPITVFVSPSGKVLGRHIGQLSAGALQADLTAAFGARPSG